MKIRRCGYCAILLLAAVFAPFAASSQCTEATITIEIGTDAYGEETSWELYNQTTGQLFASGGNYTGNSVYTEQVCVDTSGCYFFVIYDAFGDGMCCLYGQGFYRVRYNGTLIASGGSYAGSETVYNIGEGCGSSGGTPLSTDNNTFTPSQLVTDVLLGSCVSAFNVQYTGSPEMIGYFSNAAPMGMDEGILLTTGSTGLAPGPNAFSDVTLDLGLPGDADLDTAAGLNGRSRDACVLEFDFISFNDTVTFQYIFASEEYPEFVCSPYNDAFAFLVSGPGYTPKTNIALIPGTATAVAINSINNGSPGSPLYPPSNCASLTNTAYYVGNNFGSVTEYDAYTVPLTATMVVVPCATYHIKMVVADVGDGLYDSGVFLQAQSFTAGQGVNIQATDNAGSKNTFESCSDGRFTFTRDDTSSATALIINYAISGNATEGVDYLSIPDSVVIPAGQNSASVYIYPVADSLAEGAEQVIITYSDLCACNSFKRDTIFIFDNSPLSVSLAGPASICTGHQATLSANASGSASTPYVYSWSNGDTTQAITISPSVQTAYSVTVTDACQGQTATASRTVNVVNTSASFDVNAPQCFTQNDFNYINTGSYTATAIFNWSMGDSAILNSEDVLNYSYAEADSYDVQLVVSDLGCSDTAYQTIALLDTFVINISAAICPDSSVFAGGAFQNTAGTYFDIFPTANGCDSTIITTVTIQPYLTRNLQAAICPGDSFFAGGAWRHSSGIYYDTLSSAFTCDTILTTNLTVQSAFTISVSQSICEGDSFFAGGGYQSGGGVFRDTFSTAEGCDSIVITNLTVADTFRIISTLYLCPGDSVFAGGAWQTASGIYSDNFTTAAGCDSIIITNVTVSNPIVVPQNVTLCAGDSFFAAGAWQTVSGSYADTFLTSFGCDSIITTNLVFNDTFAISAVVSICAGDSFFAAGNWQTLSGIYYDSMVTAFGCDSIIRTELTVLNNFITPQNVTLCAGDSLFAGGAYRFSSGVFYDTLAAATGCDSVIITTLAVADTFRTISSHYLCPGDSVFAGGAWQTASGTYVDNLAAASGCDSIIITNVTVSNPILVPQNVTLCAGDSFFAAGAWQTISGSYADTFLASAGCDSIVNTTLVFNDTFTINNSISLCPGDSVFAGGSWQTLAGVYIDSFTATTGCDSIIITAVTALSNAATSVSAQICAGDSFFAAGAYRFTSGVFSDTFPALNGCDSIVVTNLVVADTFRINSDVSLCSGDSVFAGGNWQHVAGNYVDSFTTAAGCDSIHITRVTVNNALHAQQNISLCAGDSFFAAGAWQDSSGTFTDTLIASGGCDSIITTVIAVSPLQTVSVSQRVCAGDSIFLAGAWQTAPGQYVDSLQSAAGCDSTVITTLAVDTVAHAFIQAVICSGENYFAGGALQTVAGIYTDTLVASSGCDSIVITNLAVNDTFLLLIPVYICQGDSFFAGGAWQTLQGNYSDSFSTVNGCDSVRVTNLFVQGVIHVPVNAVICAGDSFFAAGAWQKFAGSYTDSLVAAGGCDSIITTTLTVADTFAQNTVITICQGDSLFAGGAWQIAPGQFTDVLQTASGCDSIVVITLFVDSVVFGNSSSVICAGDSLFAAGGWQTVPGIYTDTLVAAGGCDSIHTTQLAVNTVEADGYERVVCEGETIELSVSGTYYSYLWTPGGETAASITAGAGSYELTVADSIGCSDTAAFRVRENIISIYATPDTARILRGNSVAVNIAGGNAQLSYSWTPADGLSCSDCSLAVAAPFDDVIYTIVATDTSGCFDLATVQIVVDTLEIPRLYVPNAFTPNGDGVNDVFSVYIKNQVGFHLMIFDRWGEKLFETFDPLAGWDGSYHGKPCNPGVYVYYVDTRFENGFPEDYKNYQKGSVTLIR